MTDNQAVRGPMYLAATPLLVTADVEPLVHANVTELLELLAGEFYDDFREVADQTPTGTHDGHTPEQLGFENLTAQLVARMSTKVALTGPQAMSVAGRMAQLGRPLAEAAERKKAAVKKATEGLTAEERLARVQRARLVPGQREAGAA